MNLDIRSSPSMKLLYGKAHTMFACDYSSTTVQLCYGKLDACARFKTASKDKQYIMHKCISYCIY